MDLRAIRYFLAVAEEASFSKAAARLHVAQPAVSRQLQALEHELGCLLLARSSRGTELTPAGRSFYTRMKALLSEFDAIIEETRHQPQAPLHMLHIGVPPTSAEDIGVDLLQVIEAEMPDTRVELTEGLSRFLNEWLLEERLDLIVTSNDTAHDGIEFRMIEKEALVLLAPAGHRLLEIAGGVGMPLPLAALEREPLILSTAFYRLVKGMADPLGITIHCALSIDSIAASRRIMAETDRATLLPLAVARHEALDPRYKLRPLEPAPTRSLYIGQRRAAPMPGMAKIVDGLIALRKGRQQTL